MGTRDDLWKAWNTVVEKFGRGAAVLALGASTGADNPDDVKDDRIDAGIAALENVKAPISVKARIRAAAERPQASVRDKLSAMASAIYGQPR